MTHTSTEQPELPEALRLAEMLTSGAAMIPEIDLPEAAAELRRLHSRVQELEASQAQRVPLPESIPPSPTLWAFLTKGMTRKAIELLSSERDRQMYLDRAAKNWAAIRSECITQEKHG